MDLNFKWGARFMELAEHVSTWSKDPSTKVGAVIIDPTTKIVVGLGYNGFPRGVEDTDERYADRPTKYSMVVHAEVNAIHNAARPVRGCLLFITYPPCGECAKYIIQAGIVHVIARKPADTRWVDSCKIAETMFKEAGVWLSMMNDEGQIGLGS